MGGETPELPLEQVPQDASTKKLSECLKRIGDELDSNMELQRCGPPGPQESSHWSPSPLEPWSSDSQAPFPLGAWSSDPHPPIPADPIVQVPITSTQHPGLSPSVFQNIETFP